MPNLGKFEPKYRAAHPKNWFSNSRILKKWASLLICFFQVLIKLIKPYTRIHIPFISKELNIDAPEVESLLVSCILDSTVRGRIDQVRTTFILQLCKNASFFRSINFSVFFSPSQGKPSARIGQKVTLRGTLQRFG